MFRSHKERTAVKRNINKVRFFYWALDKENFRKRKPMDCGHTQCFCQAKNHKDKRKKTKMADLNMREQLNDILWL